VIIGDKSLNEAKTSGFLLQGCLQQLENRVREYWSLGQNMMLCWRPTHRGIELLMAPHCFLAKFSAALDSTEVANRLETLNGLFIKQLISGRRQMTERSFNAAVMRLGLEPVSIDLLQPIIGNEAIEQAIEDLLQRYSISYVEKRAVLLFDIASFSLFSPFEQASQLNSLSYSINSAHNKLLSFGIDVNFTRTTTGDGFYIWNRDTGPNASFNLYLLMLLVVVENAIAQQKSVGNMVPFIRCGFHIGSHYEFYQAEGLNPSMFSYIVGDVTIELARMLDVVEPGQVVMGDFITLMPTSMREGAYSIEVDTPRFVQRVSRQLEHLTPLIVSGDTVEKMSCYLSDESGLCGGDATRTFTVKDKHGLTRKAYSLRLNVHRSEQKVIIIGRR